MGGNSINVGKDRIMGKIPILDRPSTQGIISHFSDMGLSLLSQFYEWDDQSPNLIGWNFPKFPAHLEVDLCTLQTHLYGTAPLKKDSIDGFRWAPLAQRIPSKQPTRNSVVTITLQLFGPIGK